MISLAAADTNAAGRVAGLGSVPSFSLTRRRSRLAQASRSSRRRSRTLQRSEVPRKLSGKAVRPEQHRLRRRRSQGGQRSRRSTMTLRTQRTRDARPSSRESLNDHHQLVDPRRAHVRQASQSRPRLACQLRCEAPSTRRNSSVDSACSLVGLQDISGWFNLLHLRVRSTFGVCWLPQLLSC